MKKLLLLLFLVITSTAQAQNLSNRGKEFWVGYAHNSLFGNVNGGSNTQEMILYLGATEAATVTVSINGTAYSQTYNIPANSVIQTALLPKAGANDPRLTAEGLNQRGIHIVSDTPIVAYAHQYGLNSSGATMLMPVNTYAYTYYSLNYTQVTNVSVPCYSWFYAVASENNTTIRITPSVLTQGGRVAGVPFNVNLNKGEIYNVFGESVVGSGTGLDVTGSKIQSIAGTDGKCHPIAVFSGSSRITICGGSGDILQQQIFPSSAWGTNYFTYPTVSTNNINQTNLNYYRIAVRDPTTKVKKNGVQLTGLINNFYYEYSSSTGDFIEANKPVLVSQYVPSMQGCTIYDGNGDPEMFFLSPLQQAVNQASFYNTNNQNIFDNYVSLIIKNAGISTLLIDGLAPTGVTIPHPQDTAYSVHIESLTGAQQHTIISDSTFTALTYGFGQFESYGYNAGTLINNLDIIPSIKNVLSSGSKPSITACPNSPFNIIVSMAYKATKAVWHFSQVNNITPGYDTTFINPVPLDSVIVNARQYYRYKLPNRYVLKDTGIYNIPISITAPEIDNCNNTLDFLYSVKVVGVPDPAFSVNYSTCQADTAWFLSTGISGFLIKNFYWLFDDNTFSTRTNPFKVFPLVGIHPVKLTLTTDDGCLVDTTINVKTNSKPTASFGVAVLPACEGSTLTFTDTSFFGGRLRGWYWDFGNGQIKAISTNASQTSSYPNPGLYTIKHFVQSSGSCISDTAKRTIQIFAKPQVQFGFINGCLADSIVRFYDSTKISDGQALNYSWNFGDPNANAGNPNTSTLKNPVHKYTVSGTYTVTLTVTTANGCSKSIAHSVIVNPLPVAAFGINTSAQCITSNSFVFTNNSTLAGGTITYAWSFGDGGTSVIMNPVHSYASAGVYNVRLIATSNKGCKDTVINTVTVYPKPTPLFNINLPSQCWSGNNFSFTNVSTISSGTISNSWSFGDGTISTALSPIHTYALAGLYSVKLITTSDKGCKDSIAKNVTVNPKPVANYTINTVTQCLFGNSFVFTNTSSVSSGTLSYLWYFGDGLNSNAISPTHIYATAGSYAVKLVVTTNNGCKDSISKTINVLAKPTALFNINSTSQCIVGNNFVFTNISTTPVGTLTYQWYFGDLGLSNATSPSHSYISPGNYTVKLVVASSNGCKDSISKVVTINPKPTVAFTINNATQCIAGNSFSFTNNSSISAGTLTYQWFFGDGGTSISPNASHNYLVAGTYLVKLVVTSDKGCKDSITKPITINPSPTTSFTINNPAQCIVGNSFVFTNTSTVISGTLSYTWYFGDGGSVVTQNATHNYVAAGSYGVKLVATSSNGCKDSLTKTIAVGPKPVAGFNINKPGQCVTGNSFSFSSTSTISIGTITYQWAFGDGGTSGLQSPVHSYSASGSYTVRLIVTSDKGCVDTINKTVAVNPKPFSSFTINSASQCITGNNFIFTNTSTIPLGTLSFQWLFGDGGGASAQNTSHAYVLPGTYTVKLISTSVNGCTDTAKLNLTVNPKPTVAFSIPDPSQCLGGNNFSFVNSSSVSTGTMTYQWTFGDGGTSTALSPTHSYSALGVYTVRLIVTSDKGCKDSLSKTVSVNPKPQPSFNINSTAQCLLNNSFVFTNTSPNTLGTLSFLWSFGDGTTTSVQNPTHVYTNAGTYTVKLVAVAGNGCKDSISKTITVNPKPSVSFTINNQSQCFKANNLVFTNTSSILTGTMTYQWYFGDGTNTVGQNTFHSYTIAGTYIVKLVATSDKGCKDSLTKSVTVYPSPTASFAINKQVQCLSGNSYTFTNASSISAGTLSYQWSFGDGGSSTLPNPTYNYTSSGNYSVKLVVISDKGCRDSITKLIVVNPQPVVNFAALVAAQCLNGNSFTFNNSSTVSSGSISYHWAFGDGDTSIVQNPTHIYTSSGTFPVNLVVTTNNGCKDSIVRGAVVYPKPYPSYTINNASQCIGGNTFAFTNTSSIPTGTMTYLWKFGDGATSALQNPVHSYAGNGSFTVMLVAISNNGCRDSVTKTVTINPKPMAAFSVNIPNQCLRNNSFVFTNTSVSSSGTLTYQWTFGDGGISTIQNPSYKYTTSGNFTVRLIVTSVNGCKDTISKPVVVHPMPTPSFIVNNAGQCQLNNSFVFTNTSSAIAPATYLWLFGDGNTSALPNPSHTYNSSGTYLVKLIVTSVNSCRDTFAKTVNVYPVPSASFNVNSSSQCLRNNSFVFANTSTISSGTLLFQWNFGDGTFANTISPVHSYTVAGTYTVKLIVTTGNGCKDSIDKQVIVHPQSIPSFTANKINQCLAGNNFQFTNTSTVTGTASYKWSFGDGVTSTLSSPSYSYTIPGNYTVTLVNTTSNGCIDSISKPVTVYAQPIASFNVNATNQCLTGNNFIFSNNSSLTTGSILYFWKFGDGGLSNANNPTHIYASAGTYNVNLLTVSNFGCRDSVGQVINVNPQPAATFAVNNLNQCLNSNIFIFTNNSTATGIPVYQWQFGDGNISTSTSPLYVYVAPGIYNVKLNVISGSGCKDSTTQIVTVYPKPAAAFAVNTAGQCLNGNSFTFTNNTTVSSGSFASVWNFGDGQTFNGISPTHNYTSAGSYRVKLVVTTNSGCKDSAFFNVNVYPKPQVAFVPNQANQCLTGNSFVFTNNSVSQGLTNYIWTFGDGSSSGAQNPLHVYSANGVYTVKLIVVSGSGCKDSLSTTVTVNPKPTANFSANLNAQCFETNNFIFNNNSTVSSGTLTSVWSFGDGSFSTLNAPTHVYSTSGTFTVKLVTATSNGCKDSTIRNVIVNQQPKAVFNINDSTQCLKGNLFNFGNSSVVTGSGIYQWSFGDASTSTVNSPAHVYSNAGTYIVKLMVYNVAGCKDSLVKQVEVYPKVTSSFNINQSSQCLRSNNFVFANTSSVVPGTLTMDWNFGDGVTSTLTNPSHSYTTSGNFPSKLIATSDKGCKDTTVLPVVVNPMPVAAFNINNPMQCLLGNNFVFTNVSTGTSPLNYKWTFGDGGNDNQVNSIHPYNISGTYPVNLIATTTAGCADTIIHPAIVHPQPTASFTIVANGQCSNNNNYTFTNTSIISTGSINNSWSFGDGGISNLASPTHIYTSGATFPVRLIAISDKGCRDTASQSVVVVPKPNVAFAINNPGQCVNTNNFSFNNTSTAINPVSYIWSLGDGTTASSVNANHVYSNDGTYSVKLLVNGNGCLDSLTRTVTVYPKPSPAFTVDKALQCLVGNSFVLTNGSTISSGTLQYQWHFGDGTMGTQLNPVHSYTAAGLYTINEIATSNFGCIDSTKQVVEVLVNPRAKFSVNNSTQCLNDNNFVFANNSIAPSGTSFTWKFGDGTGSNITSPSKKYSTASAYKVTLYLSATNGCKSDTATTAVSVIPNPIVNAGSDLVVVEGKMIMLNASVQHGLTFKWSPSTYLSGTDVQTPLTTPRQNIGYRLTAYGQNGCTGSDSVYVKILKALNIPNVFSPNGDGVNDKWVLRSLSDYPGCTVEVFNRYGASVFSSIGYRIPWDGTRNGTPLPVGTYYYIIDPKNGLDKVSGNVTILR